MSSNQYGASACRKRRGHPSPMKGKSLSPEWIANLRAACQRRVKPLAERFEAKVDRNAPNGCHQWLGAIRTHGYGHIFVREENGKSVTMLAHHVALMLVGIERPIFPLVVDHICKNMGCVNVAHMRIVTQTFNCTTNSDSPHGINSRKTECHKGHPLAGDNLRVVQVKNRDRRICLTCYRQKRPGTRL